MNNCLTFIPSHALTHITVRQVNWRDQGPKRYPARKPLDVWISKQAPASTQAQRNQKTPVKMSIEVVSAKFIQALGEKLAGSGQLGTPSQFRSHIEQVFKDVRHEKLRAHLIAGIDKYADELYRIVESKLPKQQIARPTPRSRVPPQDPFMEAAKATGYWNPESFKDAQAASLPAVFRMSTLAHAPLHVQKTFESQILKSAEDMKTATPATIQNVIRLLISRIALTSPESAAATGNHYGAVKSVLSAFSACNNYLSQIPGHEIPQHLSASLANLLITTYNAHLTGFKGNPRDKASLLRNKRFVVSLVLNFAIVELRSLRLSDPSSTSFVNAYLSSLSTTLSRLEGVSLANASADFIELLLKPFTEPVTESRYPIVLKEIIVRAPAVLDQLFTMLTANIAISGPSASHLTTRNPLVALKIAKALRVFESLAPVLKRITNESAVVKHETVLSAKTPTEPSLDLVRSAIITTGKLLQTYAKSISSQPLPPALTLALERHFQLSKVLTGHLDAVAKDAEQQISDQFQLKAPKDALNEELQAKLYSAAKHAAEQFKSFASLLKSTFDSSLGTALQLLRVQQLHADIAFARAQASKITKHAQKKRKAGDSKTKTRTPLTAQAWLKLAEEYEAKANAELEASPEQVAVGPAIEAILTALTEMIEGPAPGTKRWYDELRKKKDQYVELAKLRFTDLFEKVDKYKALILGRALSEDEASTIRDLDLEKDDQALPALLQFMQSTVDEVEGNADEDFQTTLQLAESSELFSLDAPGEGLVSEVQSGSAADELNNLIQDLRNSGESIAEAEFLHQKLVERTKFNQIKSLKRKAKEEALKLAQQEAAAAAAAAALADHEDEEATMDLGEEQEEHELAGELPSEDDSEEVRNHVEKLSQIAAESESNAVADTFDSQFSSALRSLSVEGDSDAENDDDSLVKAKDEEESEDQDSEDDTSTEAIMLSRKTTRATRLSSAKQLKKPVKNTSTAKAKAKAKAKANGKKL